MKPVRIRHPEIEGTAVVSERAYLRVHQPVGWKLADQPAPAPADEGNDEPPEPKRPQRNDSTEAWRAYAVARGMTRDQADQLTRDGDDGLIAHFDTLDHTPEP